MGRFAVLLIAGALLPAAAASAQVPLLQYTFDEPSGQALDTGSAPASNADLSGGATRSSNTPGGFGSSLDMTVDATNAQVIGDDANKLDGLGQITMTTWLNVSAYPSGNKRLVSKQEVSGSGFTFNMNAAPNDGTVGADNFKLFLAVAGAGAAGFTSTTSSADVDANSLSAADNWVFVAATYDSTKAADNTYFYIGGIDTPVMQLGAARTMGQTTIDGGAGRVGVGFTDAADTADTSVVGFQDDVRVYGTALSLQSLDAVRLANVPEPASLGAVALGAAALLGRRRRGA